MFLLTLFLNSIVLGSLLLLFSLGLTLIYGVGRVVNFAHGALFSAGAMCGVWIASLGFPFAVAVAGATLVVGVIGVLIDFAALARIRDRPMLDSLLLTFGLALLITGVLYEFGGRDVKLLQVPATLGSLVSLFGIQLPVYRVFLAVASILITVILMLILRYTLWGIRVRAANDDAEMASCLAIPRESLMHGVVGISAALVGCAGVLAAPIYTSHALVGDRFLILAFMTVIVGGIGSLRGNIVASYLTGLIMIFGESYLGGQLALVVFFVFVMLMLLKWPRGFFGEGRID